MHIQIDGNYSEYWLAADILDQPWPRLARALCWRCRIGLSNTKTKQAGNLATADLFVSTRTFIEAS
jgi:uncharacterized protein (DUF849 family)